MQAALSLEGGGESWQGSSPKTQDESHFSKFLIYYRGGSWKLIAYGPQFQDVESM